MNDSDLVFGGILRKFGLAQSQEDADEAGETYRGSWLSRGTPIPPRMTHCPQCADPRTILAFVTDLERLIWLERASNFRGEYRHVGPGRRYEPDPEHRGEWRRHLCRFATTAAAI